MSDVLELTKVVRAAYCLDGTGQEWLDGVVDAGYLLLDQGCGVVGFTYALPPGQRCRLSAVSVRGVAPLDQWWNGLLDAGGLEVHQVLLGASREVFELSQVACEAPQAELQHRIRDVLAAVGCADIVGLVAFEEGGEGLFLGAPLPASRRFSRRVVQLWRQVGAHLAAGFRLRRALADRLEGDGAEVACSPDAELPETPSLRHRYRQALRDRARLVEQEGGDDAFAAADEAWPALLDGQWSLVDQFSSGGRRYVIARKNEAHVSDPRALSERELKIATELSRGHSNKLIGYELGLSPSTVATYVKSIMEKLGVTSRVALVETVACLLFHPRGGAGLGEVTSTRGDLSHE